MADPATKSGKKYILLHPSDNTATALMDLPQGETLWLDWSREKALTLRESIPFAHKFAVMTIAEGATVFKYGQPIGKATQDILAGDYVHIHNVASRRTRGQGR
jgi:altronate dehydratase small subunit